MPDDHALISVQSRESPSCTRTRISTHARANVHCDWRALKTVDAPVKGRDVADVVRVGVAGSGDRASAGEHIIK